MLAVLSVCSFICKKYVCTSPFPLAKTFSFLGINQCSFPPIINASAVDCDTWNFRGVPVLSILEAVLTVSGKIKRGVDWECDPCSHYYAKQVRIEILLFSWLTSKQLESSLVASKYTSSHFARVHTSPQGQIICAFTETRRKTFKNVVKSGHTVMCKLGHQNSMVWLSIRKTSLNRE